MHLKKGDKSKAIQTYTDVADMFSRGGFDAKAVAIYKQILRVEEESLEARTRLGECFQRMGLTSDALREFQDAFKICQKRELKREAFELLRRVASLDPSNIANRLNLAGLFAREGMQDDARREFTSLLEEVRRQTSADLIVRVAEQMLHAFPDSREAVDALAWAKLASGAHADAVKLLKPLLAKHPDDIALRESLVGAYEGAGDATAAKRLWREIAEMYKRRGDVEKSRDILQRHAVMEEFSAGEENTTPSILLTDSTGRTLQNDDDEVLELDDPAPARPAPAKPPAPARPATLVERGHATPPPNRAPPVPARPVAKPPPAPAQESAADMIAEARVSLEFGDPEEASRLARRVLELEPGSKAARDILAKASQSPEPEGESEMPELIERNVLEQSGELTREPVAPPSIEVERDRSAIEALAPGEDFDTLPDIEIVLEDEEDRDEKFASVEPPLSLELEREPAPSVRKPPVAKPAPAPVAAKAPPPQPDDSLDIEIEIEGEGVEDHEDEALSLEFSQPLASEQEASFGDASAKIAENLSEADFYLEQGLVDEAARIYESVLERVPHHPKAMLRMGEIAAKRQKTKPAGRTVEAADLEAAFGDTMVREPDGREALSLPEIEEPVEALEFEPSVVGEDTIPPLEELEPAPPDELVFAQDSGAPLELDPEPAVEDDGELHETSESVEGEGEFDLAAMLDEDENENTGTIGTLIGVGSVGKGFAEVFSAFKKGIQAQVDEGDADTHYDLAIAYKEMGLNEDAVRELETVLRTGSRAIEALSLLASCKLALGDAGAAAAHIEDALGRAGDSHESAVSLRYDLGEALLAAGRDREALDAFKKVAAADPDFRDVVERISRFG